MLFYSRGDQAISCSNLVGGEGLNTGAQVVSHCFAVGKEAALHGFSIVSVGKLTERVLQLPLVFRGL